VRLATIGDRTFRAAGSRLWIGTACPATSRGGVTGMAIMAMAIILFGTLWPLTALAIPLYAVHYVIFDQTVLTSGC